MGFVINCSFNSKKTGYESLTYLKVGVTYNILKLWGAIVQAGLSLIFV